VNGQAAGMIRVSVPFRHGRDYTYYDDEAPSLGHERDDHNQIQGKQPCRAGGHPSHSASRRRDMRPGLGLPRRTRSRVTHVTERREDVQPLQRCLMPLGLSGSRSYCLCSGPRPQAKS